MKNPKRVLICGGREWNNPYPILRELRALPDSITTVIHGDARGADKLGGVIAEGLDLNVISVPANWRGKGKAAGFVRNQKMLKMKPDIVLAFHEDISQSKGTRHMISIARAAGVEVRVFSK